MKNPRALSVPRSSKIVRLTIEKMTAGGRALARADGKIFFVDGAIPGETVSAEVLRETSAYAEAAAVSVESPSPSRTEPPCSLHARPSGGRPSAPRACGGCDWQHIDYSRQIELKKQVLSETLFRTGKIRFSAEDIAAETSPSVFRYRNKALVPFRVSPGTTARSVRGMSAGFYAKGTHDIVPADDCPLQPEPVFGIVNFVKNRAPDFGIDAYDEDAGRGALRHLYVRAASGGGDVLVGFVVNPAYARPSSFASLASAICAEFPKVTGVLLNENPARTNVVFGRKWSTLDGRNYVTEHFSGGLRLRLTAGAFFQVNTPVAEKLYDFAAEIFAGRPVVLDLYGGAGGFALRLSRAQSRRVVSVEEDETSVNDALVNARLNDASDITFYAISAEKFLRRPPRSVKGACVIADPPRSGLSAAALEGIAALSPPAFLYVSCDPATFSRDAGLLARKGYLPRVIKIFDMFPQTHHTETAALFAPSRG